MQSTGDRAADARWHQILIGAAEVFRTKGYAESTLRDVAEAVGIDRASL
jgi:AcrR family transcriptional regulator